MATQPELPSLQVAALEQGDPSTSWLVHDLWSDQAVGIIGGAPKAWKSFLGLDLAVSVASGTPCLGRFEVTHPGPVLIYLAEDSLSGVRSRVAALCSHRGLPLDQLPLHVVTAPSLRLDLQEDQRRLDASLRAIAPRLLLLDPLVRLHRLDENSSADISGLLGFLRTLNRRHKVAIVLVHHMSKKSRKDLGQALRGSSDINAWHDCAGYLVRKSKQRVQLTVQHRAAASPAPMMLELVDSASGAHLEVACADAPPAPLTESVRAALQRASGPMTRGALRAQLRINNKRLGDALVVLQKRRLITRAANGWRTAHSDEPSPTS